MNYGDSYRNMKVGIKKPENIRVGGNYRLLEMLSAGNFVQCGSDGGKRHR